jgi:hypothetical protein
VTRTLSIETPKGPVTGALDGPEGGVVLAVAHGAGGDMHGPFLASFAEGIAGAGFGCLRFNFPYKEQGRRAPDHEKHLRAAWSAVFEAARGLGGPVWVGGKSLGGRIASMQVADGMPAAGLVFLGYPLHPPGKPERLRDEHLDAIGVPMLFLQGTRDPFATRDLLEVVIARTGATLHAVEGGDHSFRVRGEPKDDEGTGRRLAEIAAAFIRERG